MYQMRQLSNESNTNNGIILTNEQKNNYSRDGFLILNNFIETDICDLLINRAISLINNFNPNEFKVIFSTKNRSHDKNMYFLNSGDKIRFFFEENALDENGELTRDKLLSINKIGHALHDLDPVFNCFSRMHKIASLVNDLDIQNPLLIQSMYICKQPHIGGEVVCHQDNTYLHVKDKPITGLWFALEDATIENGCMWAIPGGHQLPLKSRLLRDKENHTAMQIFDDAPYPEEKLIPLEVKRGSLIVLNGLLPHMSKENTSAKSRHAYTLHIASGQHEYAKDNWLQRAEDVPFRGFL